MRATTLLRRHGGLAHKACRAVGTPPAYVRMSTVAATRPFVASKPLGGVHKRWSTSVADADFYSSLTPELWQSLRPSPRSRIAVMGNVMGIAFQLDLFFPNRFIRFFSDPYGLPPSTF